MFISPVFYSQLEADLDQFFLHKHNGKIFIKFDNSTGDEPDNSPSARIGYDIVIRALGFHFDASIFDPDVRPNVSPVSDKYPEVNANYELISSPDIFLTGAASHSLDYRKSAGGFIHGFRYTSKALWHHLEWRNHGIPWPHKKLHINQLLPYLLRRLNEASDIYRMHSALCDVIVFENSTHVNYLQGIPYGMVVDLKVHTGTNFTRGIVVTFEYGKNFSQPGGDPFKEDRATSGAQEGHMSNFLHPVLYYYEDKVPPLEGDLKLTLPRPHRIHHIVEDFNTDWSDSLTHVLPLRWFLEHVSGNDLRNVYAESCFMLAMTNVADPVGCERDLLFS